jgi:hypothetical protein
MVLAAVARFLLLLLLLQQRAVVYLNTRVLLFVPQIRLQVAKHSHLLTLRARYYCYCCYTGCPSGLS